MGLTATPHLGVSPPPPALCKQKILLESTHEHPDFKQLELLMQAHSGAGKCLDGAQRFVCAWLVLTATVAGLLACAELMKGIHALWCTI